jgi:hypothetical protein
VAACMAAGQFLGGDFADFAIVSFRVFGLVFSG